MNYKKNFKNKGYIIIKNFLSKKNINYIKNEIKLISINQINKFNYKVKKKNLKDLLFIAMKKNPELRKGIYDLLRYAFTIRKIQSDKKILNVIKKIGFKVPLFTDIPSLRIDFSDEEKFLRGPHQDVGSIISKNCCTIWVPITRVNETNGSIALYETTHKKKLRKQILVNRNQLINNEVSLNGIKRDLRKVLNLEPGDLVIFDSFIIHESVKSKLKNNLKLNIQFIINDGNQINFKDKYYQLKNNFNAIRTKQMEKNV